MGDKVRALSLLCTDRAMTDGSAAGCKFCSSAGEEGVLDSYGNRFSCRCWVHAWADMNTSYTVVGILRLGYGLNSPGFKSLGKPRFFFFFLCVDQLWSPPSLFPGAKAAIARR